jgi:hypothetical protein
MMTLSKVLPRAWITLFVVVLVLVCLIRIRLLNLPLERDEGEYAYAGQLLLRGIPPYQLAYNMKFPGTYAAYALLMSIFGQSIAGIHLGLLFVNLATIALVFFVGRRLINSTAGIVAASSYAILSTVRSVLGMAGHATHFVVLPMLGGALLLLRASVSKKTLFVSGLLFGLALLMKQPAFFFIPFGAGYLLFEDWRSRLPWSKIVMRNALFLSGSAFPLAATGVLLWWTGAFAKFWFWALTYARVYGGIVSASEGIQMFFEETSGVIDSAWPLWILATLGLIACWSSNIRGRRPFLLGLLGFSTLAVCPGLYFREHYFILILPAVCLLVGAAITTLEGFSSRTPVPFRFIPLLLFAAACALPLRAQQRFVTAPNPTLACRMIYGLEPFPEAIQVGNYLQAHTNQDDRIAVLGSEPEIYFYAHRLSATGYIYMYALMEPHRYALQMQREMIQEIEAARPKYIVYVKDDFSWLQRENSEKLIYSWFRRYSFENFRLAGLVNIVSPDRTDYYFPPPATPESIPLSQNYLLIYERKIGSTSSAF